MNRRVSHLIAGWRTGLPRPVLILQAGNALNYFGYGLVLPFEIIYLHQIRGFSTSTAGLVLAAIMGTAAIVTPPTGALLDRYSAKAIVVAGSLASALGYAGFALAGVCLRDCRRSRVRRGRDGQPDIDGQVDQARAASGRLRAQPRRG
jgi:MFS family permease